MKKKAAYLIIIAGLLPATILAAERPPKIGPTALSIVLDSASSNKHQMSNYISLTWQGAAILEPGDYLEILSAHPRKPRIRVAHFIKTGNVQELKSVTAPLNKVKCPIFSDVNVYKAVDMALKRLIKSDKENSFAHATVIVFSDGKLKNKDVAKLQQLSKEFKKRNWSLCITGTHHTNKRLLLAAHQGEFNFSLISDANPVLWIKTQRKLTSTEPSVEQGSYLSGMHPEKDDSKSGSRVNIETRVSITEGTEKADQRPTLVIVEDTQPETEEPNEPAQAVTMPEPATSEPAMEKPPTGPRPKPVKKPFKVTKRLLWLIPALLLAVVVGLFVFGLKGANKFTTGVSSYLSGSQQKEPGILIGRPQLVISSRLLAFLSTHLTVLLLEKAVKMSFHPISAAYS